jgi:hypothetical protein
MVRPLFFLLTGKLGAGLRKHARCYYETQMHGLKRPLGRRLLLLVGLGVAGCSLLTEISTEQCETDSDCRERGGDFEGTVCEANLCVTPSAGGGDGDGDGDGDGSGGTGTGGMGGVPIEPECATNSECIDDNGGSAFICREGTCVPLTIPEECPIVLGAGQDLENLRQPEPFIFGAYSYVDPTAPRQSVATLNYELAIDEVNSATRGGIPGGAGGTKRPFIAIICSGTNNPDLELSLGHLIDDVGVPAIISSLYTSDLLDAFQTKGLPNEVFFLSPLEADSTLLGAPDDGLLWFLLPAALDLSPAFHPLLAQTEAYIRTQRDFTVDDKIKVAMVESKTPFLTDMAEDLVASLKFNGDVTALQNQADGNFTRIIIDSDLEVVNPDTSAARTALLDFEPDIILGLTSGEFVPLMNSFEGLATGDKPFYLLSPYMFGKSELANPLLFSQVYPRLLGVNFSAADDPTLYEVYLAKLKSTYMNLDFSLEGSENFYDAAYYLMYSMVGAGDPTRLTGEEVALGMNRLVSGNVDFNVGYSDVDDVVGFLRGSANSEISLTGTMGPPTFNTSTGARRGKPSIYCIDSEGNYVQNAMVYDPGTETLSGSPPCITNFPN